MMSQENKLGKRVATKKAERVTPVIGAVVQIDGIGNVPETEVALLSMSEDQLDAYINQCYAEGQERVRRPRTQTTPLVH